MRVLLALHRIGPYHHARFAAVAPRLDLQVLETRPRSAEYLWDFDPDARYSIHRLHGQLHAEADPPAAALRSQLIDLLNQLQPRLIVTVGWVDRSYQQLLVLAHQRHLPVVLISDSRQHDEPRNASKEWTKRQLIRGYSSALVAGRESRAYLLQLGLPAAAIFQPWDVVDNTFFSQAAATAAGGTEQPHFLCVSRLIPKKNHVGLLDAFARYQHLGGSWGLRLVGSGPLGPAIQAQIAKLPDPQRVQLLPFCQLEQLGQLYGQASAFVLASSTDQWGLVVNEAMAAGLPCLVSSACGCAVDLIEHGRTGWCFDPADPAALAALMLQVERQSPAQRLALQRAAHARLQAFTPEAFAAGLQQALEWAIAKPRFSRRAALTAALLSRRP